MYDPCQTIDIVDVDHSSENANWTSLGILPNQCGIVCTHAADLVKLHCLICDCAAATVGIVDSTSSILLCNVIKLLVIWFCKFVSSVSSAFKDPLTWLFVGTSVAPVSPVAVPAENCDAVAISTVPDTVSLAFGVAPVALACRLHDM